MSQAGEQPGMEPGQPDTGQERLLRELAGKDRQLRDLTEQTLGFLEELAETRRRLHDREELARRVGNLEELQADLRRRLRHAGGSVVGRVEPDGEPRPLLEVVFWGGAEAAASALAHRSLDLPVSWVGRPDAVPEAAGSGSPVQWLAHRDAHTPAQCWNLGMAATRAEAVLFLGPGVELTEAAALPATIPLHAAILSPRVVLGQTAWCGCDEADHLLRLKPRPAPAAPVAIPFASPRAFVIRRLAFEQLGLFQEDLLGTGALLEYTLRGRAHNYGVVAMPALAVHSQSRTWEEQADEHQDGDRLMVIATHRPESLGRALADAPVLWKMDAEQVPGYLARLLARIPAESNVRMVLEHIALGLIEHALPVADAIEQVGRHRLELLGALAQDAGREQDQVAAALQRARTDRPSSAASAFRELGEDLALERRIWAAMIQEMERAHAEALQQLRPQIEQIAAERDAHKQALQQIQSDLQQVQARLGQAHAERDRSRQELEQMQAQVQQVEEEYQKAQRDLLALQGERVAVAAAAGVPGSPEPERLRKQIAQLHRDAEQLGAALAATGTASAEALVRLLQHARTGEAQGLKLLEDRNHWIGLLLQEVTRRRLVPRKLLEHERTFLEQLKP